MSSQTSKLPDVLVVDANVLLSALIGGRAADALAELGPARVRAAAEVRDEVRRWLPELAAKRRLEPTVLLAGLQIMPVRWCERDAYGWLELWARGRMAGRDEEDWPTLALARALT
jgi:PIN domain